MGSLFPQVKAHANQCAPDNSFAFDANGNSLAPAGITYQKATRQKELQFVQAYMNQVYYWQAQMPQVSPDEPAFAQGEHYLAVRGYLGASVIKERLPNGKFRDRFSDVRPIEQWQQTMEADQKAGPGVTWAVGQAPAGGLVVRVARVSEAGPAAAAGVQRGDRLLAIRSGEGSEIVLANIQPGSGDAMQLDLVMEGIEMGAPATLRFRNAAGQVRTLTLNGARFPKQLVTGVKTLTPPSGAGKIGYLSIEAFQSPLEGQLKTAMERLKAEGVQDLVVDLRYNGGGLVDQSAQLAYMTADPARSQGKLFSRFSFNEKMRPLENLPDSQLGFIDKTTGDPGTGTTAGQALPNLGLRRVYVLTTQASCSASEEYINGLRGIDVEVVVIGDTTCGKPFVQIPQQNCGLAYLPVLGRALNAKGQGDYDEGIAPTCRVADDLSRPQGDANDPLMVAALHHRQHGACPAGTDPASTATKSLDTGAPAMRVLRSPLMEASIVRPEDLRRPATAQ
ncbi:MAG: S41 family peptidase [Lautropia sp.]|nr:S41 family peptidase [Lautropia sp.]